MIETTKTLAGVKPEFVVRLVEALLQQSEASPENRHLREKQFGGVNLKLLVNSHWAGFERFMLVGPDWQCGFNLDYPRTEADKESELCFTVFGATQIMTAPGLNGRKGFHRDMTVLRMTYSDWMLPDQPVAI